MATFTGTNAAETISGFDDVFAGGGNDSVTGTAGNDFLRGQGGNDTLDGGTGNDTLDGGNGNDSVSGGAGNDRIRWAGGRDTLDGGNGTDTLDLSISTLAVRLLPLGNQSLELTTSTSGANQSFVSGFEKIIGGGFADIINLESYGAGAVDVSGGAGNDTLIGSAGARLTGGADADTFALFGSVGGICTVTDFTTGTDVWDSAGFATDVVGTVTAIGGETGLLLDNTSIAGETQWFFVGLTSTADLF